jgi:hypothetical protein
MILLFFSKINLAKINCKNILTLFKALLEIRYKVLHLFDFFIHNYDGLIMKISFKHLNILSLLENIFLFNHKNMANLV